MNHYLVIVHESYDSSTVLGIFETFIEARDRVESLLRAEGQPASDDERFYRGVAHNAVIEAWHGSDHLATYERRGLEWR